MLEVARKAGVEAVDVWTLFMGLAGWDGGEVLTGSVESGKSDELGELLVDGESFSHTQSWGSPRGRNG